MELEAGVSVLRFRVRGKDYAAIDEAITDEIARFDSFVLPDDIQFDAEAVHIESNGGERRLLEYVADVVVRFP